MKLFFALLFLFSYFYTYSQDVLETDVGIQLKVWIVSEDDDFLNSMKQMMKIRPSKKCRSFI